MDEGTLDDGITMVNSHEVNCDMRAFLQFQGSQIALFSALPPVTSEKHSYLFKELDGVTL